jgi:outer membrane receptor for ferrienterochelin and colicins
VIDRERTFTREAHDMTSVRNPLLSLLAFCCLAATPALAQTGAITGSVTDAETGAPIGAAQVRAVAGDGAIPAAVQSGDDGQYRLANVPAGTYTVVANRVGFREVRMPGVAVAAGATVSANIAMQSIALMLSGEVVVGIRRQERLDRAPASIQVVSTERVEERPTLVPTEHLRGMPGIDYAQTGLMSTTVVARGFSNIFSTSLLSITDYRYTNVPSLRVNSSFLMPAVNDDVERVEVLLGPGSAVYGPNAANGVMHIITRGPFSHPGTTISVTGGERDVLSGSLRHAGVVGERLGYKVTGQWMQGREWEFVDAAEVAARASDPTIPARDLDLERWTGELRADYRIAQNSELIFNAGRVNATNAIELTPFGAAQARDWKYTYFQTRLTANRFFAQVFLNTSDAGNTFLLRTGDPIVDESRLVAVQVQHSTPLGERQTFSYGVDVQRTDPRTGGTIHGRFEDDDDSDEIGGYLLSETQLSPQFDLILAARLDHHSRVDGNVLSPRAGIVFRPSDGHNFRFTYNRAFGTPLNSQLFLDILAGSVGPLPFEVRGIGGSPGYSFRRDCVGGICVRSPFVPDGQVAPNPAQFRDLDATIFWGTATNILFAQSGGTVDIRMIPAPSSAQVGTVLRLLNPHPGGAFFATVSPGSLTDVSPLRPSFSDTYEAGYKGILGNRMSLSVDLWRQKRTNFVSAALVETPNMFLERNSLAAYLSNFMAPAQAAQIAAGMAGIDGNPAATGIPLGTANWDSPFTQDQHVYLTYRNYGDVTLWGSDLAVEALLTDQLTLTGGYSWLSDDTFRTVDFAGNEALVALNAPANKGSVGLRWSDRNRGLSVNSQLRFVDGFPMNSGVYVGDVESYTVVDLGLSWRVPTLRGTMFTIQAQNILNDEHQQFIGAPTMGRLVTGRVSYTF